MKLLPVLAISSLALVMTGCQLSSPVKLSKNEGYSSLEGSKLILKTALDVPAGRSRVFVQDGVLAQDYKLTGNFDSYRTHCGFEIRSVAHEGYRIEPGSFNITRVQSVLQPVVMGSRIMVAELKLANNIDGADGQSSYYEGYHFWLSSETESDVMRMSCFGVYALPHELDAPTLSEINATLGDVAEIQ